MSSSSDTLVQCAECERVYAAYYTPEGDLRTPAGAYCPNCDGDRFRENPALDT